MLKQRFLVVFILFIVRSFLCSEGVKGTPYTGCCSEVDPITILPGKAQQFIRYHFKAYQFDELKKIKRGLRLFFLANGYIEFDVHGTWRDINGEAMQLPSSLLKELPEPAVSYIKKGYKGTGLKRIVKKNDSYMIWFIFPKDALLVFDLEGKLLTDTLLDVTSD